jgi:hypothetical protein
MLVALAPVAAKAGFIIDSFNGSFHSLPGGVTITSRVLNPIAGSSTFTNNGTNATITLSGFGVSQLAYTFSGPLSNTGDTLGGTPGLKLDFLGSTGLVSVAYSLNNGGTFLAAPGLNASAAPFSTEFATPGLLAASTLIFQFQNGSSSAVSFVIDRMTATPEPTTLLLFGSVAGLGLVARRKFRKIAD